MTQTASDTAPPRSKMTFEEFLASIPDDVHAEWEDGEVIYLTVEADNSDLQLFLAALLRFYIDLRSAGRLLAEPFVMKTGPDLPGRSPDLFFVARENAARVKRVYLDGPADLAIEIVSPESGNRDRGAKFEEYEAGGVGEYWLIDPQRQIAEFFVRDPTGVFRQARPDSDGVYRSSVLGGFWLRVDWLWQSPLPPVPSTLKEMGLI
jgi:Uma2 family endonuclease